MSSNNLLIVFAKNILLGKVKTRLAASVGDYGAFEVYKHLVGITESETDKLDDCDIRVYWTDVVIGSKWSNAEHFVQEGADLGERMKNAFEKGFEDGYERIIGIGSDLPDITVELMNEGISALNRKDSVFGPSEDGGYYLIGMNQLLPYIFENKSWSTEVLMNETKQDLEKYGNSVEFLKTLNDIDTLEDLKASSVADKFNHLYELSTSDKRSL